MKSFVLERWDAGRLTVNRDFAGVLSRAGLDTFEALWRYSGGTVAKDLLPERTTIRIDLPADATTSTHGCALYVKRLGPPPLKEYVKPLLRLRRPILGAENEWNAILRFHALGIPTMVPAALGRSGRRSLLVTEAISGCRKLSACLAAERHRCDLASSPRVERLAGRLGRLARIMHAAGLHHQDFYLTHLLVPEHETDDRIFVIDLGRVRHRRRLARRWIVKDLAQLSYSSAGIDPGLQQTFLAAYLNRPPGRADRPLIGRIERKTRSIARHSRKHRL